MNPVPSDDLIRKYNVPAPRYTSYPTVPFWESAPDVAQWRDHVQQAFTRKPEVSVYIHLPYCERLCTYCGCNTRITRNHEVERPYQEAIVREWELYREIWPEAPTLRELHLGGGTPTFFQPDQLEAMLGPILTSSRIHPQASMGFEAHPNSTRVDHLLALYGLGFRRISIGVQDFGDDIMRLINRRQSTEQVYQLTRQARQVGFTSVNFDLIFGLPKQTITHIDQTMNHIEALRPERIAFYSYAHVPWMKPGQRAYSEADLPAEHQKRALYEHGRAQLEAMGYIEIGMDHFALPGDELQLALEAGHLHRNFMGYTPFATELLVGLGASAISDAGTAFAQNEKSVEDYHSRIAEGRHPIFKGHQLNDEDRRLRRHISEIMCNLTTRLAPTDLEDPAVADALAALQTMEADGLLVRSGDRLQVTERGRPFVRNIGMAFDARLKRRQPETSLFSQSV